MGDLADDFREFERIKREERAKKEPERFRYVMFRLEKIGFRFQKLCDYIVVYLPKGTAYIYPFTGWFQGQKPYGYIRGRGINKFIKFIEKLK